eukprot:1151686-Pelagomonas_calceolata.AAC.4
MRVHYFKFRPGDGQSNHGGALCPYQCLLCLSIQQQGREAPPIFWSAFAPACCERMSIYHFCSAGTAAGRGTSATSWVAKETGKPNEAIGTHHHTPSAAARRTHRWGPPCTAPRSPCASASPGRESSPLPCGSHLTGIKGIKLVGILFAKSKAALTARSKAVGHAANSIHAPQTATNLYFLSLVSRHMLFFFLPLLTSDVVDVSLVLLHTGHVVLQAGHVLAALGGVEAQEVSQLGTVLAVTVHTLRARAKRKECAEFLLPSCQQEG